MDVGACVVGPEVLGCWVVEGSDVGIVGENAGPWVKVLGGTDLEGLVVVLQLG